MKEAEKFGPLITAAVTPFGKNGELDIEGTKRLTTHLIDTGTFSVVHAGTTGESPNLAERERMLGLQATLEAVADRGRVITGTSTYSTAESVKLSKLAQQEGAHGLLLVTPYYNNPDQEGMFRHFAEIAQAVKIPCILYNVPSRTSRNLLPETVLRLDREFENVVGLKEAIGTSDKRGKQQVTEIIAGKSAGFQVWSGNDQDTLIILRLGGFGVVSVGSHLVGMHIKEMIRAHTAGEHERAQSLHDYLMPLFAALFPPKSPRPSPSAVKAMLNIVGLPAGDLRLPVIAEPESYQTYLRNLLGHYNLMPTGGEHE